MTEPKNNRSPWRRGLPPTRQAIDPEIAEKYRKRREVLPDKAKRDDAASRRELMLRRGYVNR